MNKKSELSQTLRIDLLHHLQAQQTGDSSNRASPEPTNIPARFESCEKETATVSDSTFQRLLQGTYDAAIISNLNGEIVDVNVRAEEFFGFMKSEITGCSVLHIIAGSDAGLLSTVCHNLEGERFTLIQAYCVRQDGSYFPAEIAVSRIDLSEPCLCFFVRDITLRKRAEEMLRTEHNAIQNSGNGIAIASTEGVIEFVNPAAEAMWRRGGNDGLLGALLQELFVDEDGVRAIFEELQSSNGATWSGEMKARRSDDSLFDIQLAAAQNRNSEGETISYVLSFIDISDRLRARDAERDAERKRVMLESLGAACHHVGQPATILMGNLELLNNRLETSDDVTRSLIATSLEAMEEIRKILQRLNDVSEYRTSDYLREMNKPTSIDSKIIQI